MNARRLLVLLGATALCGGSQAGVFFGATSTSLPSGMVMHPKGYSGAQTAISNTVCFNPAVLPSGVTETQVDNAIKKAVATWNAQRTGQNNYATSNNDITAGYYDFESAVLHEIGHCIGVGHPTIATGTSGGTANATASRADAGGSYDLDAGSDGIYGSRDDSRGDNTNLYWFYTSSNDPLAYPSIIDSTTFSQATGSLPSGHNWPANANNKVTAALGYSNAKAVMTWNIDFGEARRRLTAEDMSVIKFGMAGKNATAGNSDDYTLALSYDSSVSSCDIPVSFSSSTTSLGVCSSSYSGLGSSHYALSGQTITFSSTVNWYFSQGDNTTTTITSDSPDPSTVNSAYTVGVSVARNSTAMSGAPSGSVLVSDGSATCTATLSGSTSPATGLCSLTSTTSGTKTLTATYLGYQGFDSSSGTATHTVNLPAPTVTVSDSPDPTDPGGAYTVSFTLSGSYGTPTGTVSVSDGAGASCGPVTLASGAGSCSITSTKGGNKTLKATYSGDSNYSSTNGTTAHTVNYLTPTFSASDAPDPSATGVSYTVSTSASGSYTTPSGTVTISVSDGHGCSITLASGTGSCSIGGGSRGTLTIDAEYSGDSVYNASAKSFSHTVKDASTTTITAQSPGSSTVGQSYTVSFGVANSNVPATTPTGTVTVSDGSASCSGTLAAGAGSCSLASTTVGTKTLTATYAGDGNVGGSSATASHTVNKATPTVTVGHSPTSSIVAQSYTVTFGVAQSGGATPTGSVTVSDGTDSCSGTLTSGSGSCSLRSTTAGSKTLTASYGGDGNYNSASGTLAHTVSKVMPTVVANDPSGSSTVGQAYTVSTTVRYTNGATPTGTVTMSDGSATCSITLASGTGSCSLTSTSVGSKTISASYGGDSNYNTGSGTLSPHVVSKGTPTVTVTDANDPSAIGASYAVSVSVAQSGGPTPSGSVTVSDGSASCTIATLSSGSGSCNLVSSTAGTKAITASYGGDSSYNSTTGSTTHTVSKASPTLVVTPPASASVGSAYTVAVTVSQSGSTAPSGAVGISDGSATCTAMLTGGAGTCNLTSTTAGAKTISASYAGDSNYNNASASASLTVNKATPTVTVSDMVESSVVGAAYAVNVTVAQSGGAAATGNATVSDGSATCTIALAAGAGSCNLVSASAGTKTLTASYAGDGNYNAASGSTTHDVSKATPALAVTADSPDPSVSGGSYTVSVGVTSSAGSPSGTVTMGDGETTCTATLASGVGSCNFSTTQTGDLVLYLHYNGDGNFEEVTAYEDHRVNLPTPTVSVSDTPDPSDFDVGYSVSFHVAGNGATPTGTVTVSDGFAECSGDLDGNGDGSCAIGYTHAGTRTVTASYAGDTRYNSASGSTTHTVNKGTPSFNISTSPDPSTLGDDYSVSVGIGSFIGATGTASVSDGTANCAITLDNGAGNCVLHPTSAGTLSVSVSYAGDDNYVAASATTSHIVELPVATLSIVSHAPDPSDVAQGYVVTVNASGSNGTPGGTVALRDGSPDLDGTRYCSVTLSNGTGSCTLASAVGGTRTLTATYAGDANYQGAVATAMHAVNRIAPGFSVNTPSEPSIAGETYRVNFALTHPAAGDEVFGDATVSDGSNSCTASIYKGGGHCDMPAAARGSVSLSAHFSGSITYLPADATLAHAVVGHATTTTITAHAPSPTPLGDSYTVSVSVGSSSGTPGGDASVSDGAGHSCTATLNDGSGSCDLPTAGASVGTRGLSASYAGDSTHEASASETVSHAIGQGTPTLAITAISPEPSSLGGLAVVSVQASGGGVTPTGSVQVGMDGQTCTVTLGATGSGSCSLTATQTGARTVNASYGGDGNYVSAGTSGNHGVVIGDRIFANGFEP